MESPNCIILERERIFFTVCSGALVVAMAVVAMSFVCVRVVMVMVVRMSVGETRGCDRRPWGAPFRRTNGGPA